MVIGKTNLSHDIFSHLVAGMLPRDRHQFRESIQYRMMILTERPARVESRLTVLPLGRLIGASLLTPHPNARMLAPAGRRHSQDHFLGVYLEDFQ